MHLQVLVLLILAAIGLADEQCCKNYNDVFIVSYEYENWHQALINCKAAGMKLATITSKEDEDNFEKFLNKNGYNGTYWLGGTNLGNKGYYWATTGEPVVYTKWSTGQPDNSGKKENCIQWGIGNRTVSAWNDLNCALNLLYICEKEPCCSENVASDKVCWCTALE